MGSDEVAPCRSARCCASTSGALSVSSCLLAALVLMEAAVFLQTDVRARYDSCAPSAGIPSESLDVVINRLEWLSYNLSVALTGSLFVVFVSVVMHAMGKRTEGRVAADSLPPYTMKLVRFTALVVSISCCCVALSIAAFAPLDYLSHMITGCTSVVTGRYKVLAARLWMATMLLVMSAAWGAVWALSSVASPIGAQVYKLLDGE